MLKKKGEKRGMTCLSLHLIHLINQLLVQNKFVALLQFGHTDFINALLNTHSDNFFYNPLTFQNVGTKFQKSEIIFH